MGLFGKKKEAETDGSVDRDVFSRSGSIKSTDSVDSRSKFHLFKSKNGSRTPSPEIAEIPRTEPTSRKRVSTIVEADDLSEDSQSDTEDSDESISRKVSSYSLGSSESSESDSEDDYEEHEHAVKDRGKGTQSDLAHQLSTIMGYCGLKSMASAKDQVRAANEESKRTYSLLGSVKIHRIPPADNSSRSVIGDDQIALIEDVTNQSNKLLDCKSLDQTLKLVAGYKTLYERYGTVKDLIGKGAYGTIKLLDSDPNSRTPVYAVKEIKRRPKENNTKFIERVVSEFIISSTLNNKHVVKTIDLMVTLPAPHENTSAIKFNQVMECSPGGDLFSYLTTTHDKNNRLINYVSFDEFDCMVKQIAKGLKYMHQHGVAHCDLKLENILLYYRDYNASTSKLILRLTDFGKSNVFRTKLDTSEQYYRSGPIGSEPYMAPEEYDGKPYSLSKKDCWALGIVILTLFNIRRHYYSGSGICPEDGVDPTHLSSYSAGYLWSTVAPKHSMHKDVRYKDKVFDEYVRTKMNSSYDSSTKEWFVTRSGSFKPVEQLFDKITYNDDNDEKEDDDELDDLCDLRKMLIYKMLDVDPRQRPTVDQFLRSDWMTSVENCT